jgi:hypothetical protein
VKEVKFRWLPLQIPSGLELTVLPKRLRSREKYPEDGNNK